MRYWPYIESICPDDEIRQFVVARSVFLWKLDEAGRLTQNVVQGIRNDILGVGTIQFGSQTRLKAVRQQPVVLFRE